MITYEAVYEAPSSLPFLSKTIDGIYTKMNALGPQDELAPVPNAVIESHLQNLGAYLTNASSSLTHSVMAVDNYERFPFQEGEDIAWALDESSLWWEYLRVRMLTQESESA